MDVKKRTEICVRRKGPSMKYDYISRIVQKLKKKYRTDDVWELCDAMNVIINPVPMGSGSTAVKGFFIRSARMKVITINSDLPEIIQRIIVAHEICHAMFHCRSGIHAFHEVALFDQNSIMEKEANLFAAEYLLSDEKVFDVLNRDTTFFSAASALYVPAELLDFKFRLMKWKGYKLIEPPISARSNFLRDIDIPDDTDYS